MKLIATFMFILLGSNVLGQFSISAGINRRSEYIRRGNLHHFNSFQTGSRRYTHDYFNVKIDYQKRWLMLSGEVTFLTKNNIQSVGSMVTSAGWYGSTVDTYEATTDFSYLGLRLTPNVIFQGQGLIFKKAKAGVILGTFFQIDFRVAYSEDNHLITTTFPSGNYFTNDYSFQALDVDNVFLSGGLKIARRTSFKYFFIEVNASLGISERMTFLMNTDGQSAPNFRPVFMETGASIGYIFTSEEK